VKLFDVNVLIHAHRRENAGHRFCRDWLIGVLGGRATFLYCEWILASFVRVVTHPRIYRTPTPTETALEFTDEIRARENGIAIMPGARHWGIFADLCRRPGVVGNLVPDAYLAALAIEADAEWVTTDRDFERFEPDLRLELLRP
jgi:hypothetical protein